VRDLQKAAADAIRGEMLELPRRDSLTHGLESHRWRKSVVLD
jgi:hypothetical protein